MTRGIGTFLRELRSRRGLSLGRVAAQAGIGKSTLSEWEAGLHAPDLPPLEAVLAALGASAGEREQALMLVPAPRAVRLLRAQVAPAVAAFGMDRPALPAGGDLLRALRGRRGLTLQQVATHLGVQASTVSRWEQAKSVPPWERLDELLRLLGARPDEQQTLLKGRVWLAPSDEMRSGLPELKQQLEALKRQAHGGDHGLLDLRFLALEAHLWPRVAREADAAPLLAATWAQHALFLSWEDRKREAGRYANLALDWARQSRARDPDWLNTAMVAVHVTSMVTARGGAKKGPAQAIELLGYWLPATTDPMRVSGIYRDLSSFAAEGGRLDAAIEFGRQACETADRTENPYVIRLARDAHAEALLRAGQPQQGLALLPSDGETLVVLRILETLQWVRTLLALGERSGAHERLSRAYALLRTYHYPNHQRAADDLARQF